MDVVLQRRSAEGQKRTSLMKLWLHSQQSVLILDCVALTRLFFDILRTAAAGTSKAGIGRVCGLTSSFSIFY
jgi:hypothetical protein